MARDRIKSVFAGKTALVTGAASGIGGALAIQLAAAGALVYAMDRDAQALRALAGGGDYDRRLRRLVVDVTDRDSMAAAVQTAIAETGIIDYLFNNAGITLLGESHVVEFPRWRQLLDVNVMGVINGIIPVYRQMITQSGGHIVNTSSIAGSTGYATAAAYSMSKASVSELSRSLRAEAAGYGIRVSVACPGYVASNIFTQERVVGADLDRVLSDLPVKMMSPQVAGAAILDGVARGKHTIVFPWSARILWHLSHWLPGLLNPIQRRLLRPFSGQSVDQ